MRVKTKWIGEKNRSVWWQKAPPFSRLDSMLWFFFFWIVVVLKLQDARNSNQIKFFSLPLSSTKCNSKYYSNIICFDFNHLSKVGCFQFSIVLDLELAWLIWGFVPTWGCCSEPSPHGCNLGNCSYGSVGDNVDEKWVMWCLLFTSGCGK